MISLKTISEKLNARRRTREAVSELSKLSDHELSDIGISRGEIEYAAKQTIHYSLNESKKPARVLVVLLKER